MEINMKNYDYLKNQVKFLGFGENLDSVLKEKIQAQEPEFTLPHQAKFGQDDVSSTLHFSKSKESELYFFNGYDLALKQPGKDDVLKQSYYVGKENNYTLKERYNMLDSRAVFKELNKLEVVGEGDEKKLKATDQTYKGWKALDFKETDDRGNFKIKNMFWDHEKAIEKYPIKELEVPYDRNRLLASLEKGNITRMTVIREGVEIKGTMAANPRQEGFDFYDSNNQRLELNPIEKQQEQKQVQGEAATMQQKEGGAKAIDLQNYPADQPDSSKPAESSTIGREYKQADQKQAQGEKQRTRRQGMRAS